MNGRLRGTAGGVVFGVAAAAIFLAGVPVRGAGPNIVFVLFDDMGWGQPPGYNPQSALRTPNLDRLAAQGMRFTDAHSASAVCTPTRYGVLTGRYPVRIGQFGVLETWSRPLIPPSRVTVASMLKEHGYATACIGKWHLGMNWVTRDPGRQEMEVGDRLTDGPNALGFDYFCGFTHARNIQSLIEQDRCIARIQPVESQPLLVKKALEWIDGCAKKGVPFFLYFPMCPPHTPVVPAAEFIGKSGARDLVLNDPKYGDWLYQGDAMLGQILEALDRNGLADKTLVIATSDNGAEHRAYEPLRESKRSIYEGGHRVPFVVRWPGKVKPGSVNDHTICLNDLLATAAEIVGAKLPDDAGEDSVSLVAEFLGTAQSPARAATVHQSMAGDLAVRQGDWKLIVFKDGRRELYNLRSDLSETKDLGAGNPEVVARLTALLQGCLDQGRSTPGAARANNFSRQWGEVLQMDGKTEGKPTPPARPAGKKKRAKARASNSNL
jgi:arylsulfatase A